MFRAYLPPQSGDKEESGIKACFSGLIGSASLLMHLHRFRVGFKTTIRRRADVF
jgi:hypothetical protein